MLRIAFASLLCASSIGTASSATVDFLNLLLRQPVPRLLVREQAVEADTDLLVQRVRTMQDEHGHIPPGAVYRAIRQRAAMLAAGPRGHSSIATNSASIATNSASIAPTAWTSRGPLDVGGRTNAILIDPNNSLTIYAGAASGGVWRSTDGGQTWLPIDDFLASLVIGSMAFDPTSSSRIYIGTGQRTGYDRNNLPGAGVWVGTYNGSTWSFSVLNGSEGWMAVTSIAARPGSSCEMLAAVDGGKDRQASAGIWRRKLDASNNCVWEKMLSGGDGRGVTFDSTGQHALASMYLYENANNQRETHVYMLSDWTSGSFTQLNTTTIGSVAQALNEEVAMAFYKQDWHTIYLNYGYPLYGAHSELVRSSADQSGNLVWSHVTESAGQTCDYQRCALWVSPTDSQVLVGGGVSGVYRSTDGGQTFIRISAGDIKTADPHVDIHCFANDPGYDGGSNKIFYVGTDGGIFKTTDILNASLNSGSWTPLNSTYQTTQFYSASGSGVGNGTVFGGTQDNGSLSTSGTYYSGSNLSATLLVGADGGYTQIDRIAPSTWYFTQQDEHIFRSFDSGATHTEIDGQLSSDRTASSIRPIVLDPNNSFTMLAAGNTQVWRTLNVLTTSPQWNPILNASGYSIAIAPSNSDVIYVGQVDGTINKTTNGTQQTPSWNPVNRPQQPARPVNCIVIDPLDANIVYAGFGGWASGNLWRTTNGGTSWQNLTGFPDAPVRSLARHPRDARRLYLATDLGIYESEDGGSTWSTQTGVAAASTNELSFLAGTTSNLLLAATFGRGMWTADVNSVPSFTVTGVNALASGTALVNVNWNAISGATYSVWRSSNNQPYSVVGTTSANTFPDTNNVVAGKTYLYKVTATVNGLPSNPSNIDLATTVVFTDDNQLLGKSVRATYLQGIRDAVNMVRVAAGLSQLTWSPPLAVGDPIRITDITDLRTGLAAAYQQIGLPSPTWGESITNTTVIKASHSQELRDKVK